MFFFPLTKCFFLVLASIFVQHCFSWVSLSRPHHLSGGEQKVMRFFDFKEALFIQRRSEASCSATGNDFYSINNSSGAPKQALNPSKQDLSVENGIGWSYRIIRHYETQRQKDPILLPRLLVELDPEIYPTLSRAKKACSYGEILIFVRGGQYTGLCLEQAQEEQSLSVELLENLEDYSLTPSQLNAPNLTLLIGTPLTMVHADMIEKKDIICIAVITRSEDRRYPPSKTGYIFPPPSIIRGKIMPKTIVVYEDHELAVLNKPENLTTIGQAREDLQSALPFLLEPPSQLSAENRLPRPVHRLDRRTNGLVLCAKSKQAMRRLSKYFADGFVQKTYMALVTVLRDDESGSNTFLPSEAGKWNKINYPIDGKNALTEWRVVKRMNEKKLALLEVRPRTGRFHQIRRHLAYCLGCPIVGDAKYDGGGTLARSLRINGMFLCSNGLMFPYSTSGSKENENEHNNGGGRSTVKIVDKTNVKGSLSHMMQVTIHLPKKFQAMMEL